MKLRTVAALAACCAVFSGCSVMKGITDYNGEKMEVYSINAENGFDILNSALRKYSTSSKKDIENEITISQGNVSLKQNISYTSGDENISYVIFYDYMGQTETIYGYYSDGFLYTDSGMKNKTRYKYEYISKSLDIISLLNFSKNSVKETNMSRNGDNTVIEVVFNDEEIMQLLENELYDLKNALRITDNNIKVDSMSLKAEVTDQYDIVKLDMNLGISINSAGGAISSEYKQSMTVNAIGDDTPAPKKVENPDEYYDLTSSLMGNMD